MHTITITGTTRERVVNSGQELLAVGVTIDSDGDTIAEHVLGFALDTSEADIREELAKVLTAFVRDQEIATETQRSEELNANADELQAQLEGVTIKHE